MSVRVMVEKLQALTKRIWQSETSKQMRKAPSRLIGVSKEIGLNSWA